MNTLQILQNNLPLFAKLFFKIRTKDGSFEPLILNDAQKYVHERLELQLKTRGYVRAIILKGRQQGMSTYITARFFHKSMFNMGRKTFVITNEGKATTALFDMVKRFYDHLKPNNPKLPNFQPSISKNNSNEMVFDNLGSSFKVSTAGNGATGRGETFQLFHGSEVSFWPRANEEEIKKGAIQAVAQKPGTEVILESTANGADGYFYEECMKAMKGIGKYELIFVPWFWTKEYREPVGNIVFNSSDREYQTMYGIDDEQLAWRINKIIELGSEKNFRQEYPATVEEAFRADVEGALWTNDVIEKHRVKETPELQRTVVGVDPAVTTNPNSDETGISVAGKSHDGHVYVLDDISGKMSADVWARKALDAYYKYNAGMIVVESNQGGDLVINAIRAIDPTANVVGKHVSVAKQIRHEPVAALYTRGMVHHVGVFSELERQMVTWSPAKKKESPDRVDALTLAVGELGLKPIRAQLSAAII